jgi:chromosomal replication initiator protein
LELPAHPDLAPTWREIRAELRRSVGESQYDIWLAPVELKAWDGVVMLLEAPPATQAWVAKRFGRILESCAQSVVGAAIRIAFAGSADTDRPQRDQRDHPQTKAGTAFNPRYSFDQFIIGDGNRLAHAASLAVAELPGQAYNPLFLHAPPGLGKTHLLHAIGNYSQAFGAGASVRYTTVEAFTNQFLNALSTRSVDRFKQAYRNVDVLLIDDVQFLASKAKTGEEFFHTFNALYETGGQLVLTCDRLPHQLLEVEERLRERFESGLVADIHSPDFPTRVAILRKRAALDNIRLNDPLVLELIAERITDNIRSLEGALIRIVAHHSLTGEPLGIELARRVLDRMHPERSSRAITPASIQNSVASFYGITVDELLSQSRAARVAWPRQVAIHLARELTHASLNEIGAAFGGRNHATVIHACKRVAERVREDSEASAQVSQLTTSLAARQGDRTC